MIVHALYLTMFELSGGERARIGQQGTLYKLELPRLEFVTLRKCQMPSFKTLLVDVGATGSDSTPNAYSSWRLDKPEKIPSGSCSMLLMPRSLAEWMSCDLNEA